MNEILPKWYKKDLIDSENVPLYQFVNRDFIIKLGGKENFWTRLWLSAVDILFIKFVVEK